MFWYIQKAISINFYCMPSLKDREIVINKMTICKAHATSVHTNTETVQLYTPMHYKACNILL